MVARVPRKTYRAAGGESLACRCPGRGEAAGPGFAAVPAAYVGNPGGAMQVFEQQIPPCAPAGPGCPVAGLRPRNGRPAIRSPKGEAPREVSGGRQEAGGERHGHRHRRTPCRRRRPHPDPVGSFFPGLPPFATIRLNGGLTGGCANYGEFIH